MKKITLKEIGEYLGVKDLRLTHYPSSGDMYTARNRAGWGPRIFVAWDKKHLRIVARGLFEDENCDNGKEIR